MSTGLSSEASRTLPAGVIVELLSDRRRRAVLDVLQAHEKPLALADVAKEVTLRAKQVSLDTCSVEEIKCTQLKLHHQDIPLLADYGIVEYNKERRTVTLTEQVEQLDLLWELKANLS